MAPYIDARLRSDRKEIRLLRLDAAPGELSGCLEVVSLAHEPIFEALSYTWGQPPFKHTIKINECTVSIGSNLHAALIQLKQLGSTVLWVDALCIAQDDEVERQQQVRIMQEIFIAATKVRAWLGVAENEGDKALLLLRDLTEEQLIEFQTKEFKCPSWIALKNFWSRPYWRRIWIVQELAVANGRALLGCGDCWVARSELQRGLDILNAHRNNPDTLLWESIESHMDWLLNLSQICRSDIHSWGKEHLLKLESLLYLTEQCEASVSQDHFFALLGLCEEEDRKGVEVNYGVDLAETCAQVFERIINQTHSLNVLSGNRSIRNSNLSSWMPSFSDPVRRGYGWNSFRTFSAAGKTEASFKISSCRRRLTSQGVEIGTINNVSRIFFNSKSEYLDIDAILTLRNYAKEAISNNAKFGPVFWETIFANRATHTYLEHDTAELENHFIQLENAEMKTVSEMERAQTLLGRFLCHFVPTLRYRRFFTTSSGFIGVGPSNIEKGDIAVVLLGSDVPVILKLDISEYELKGDAFVHGVMDGELVAPSLREPLRKKFILK
jgi:hypothetical protein